MYFRSNVLKPLSVIILPLGLMLIFLSLTRLGFFIWQFERIQEAGQFSFIFTQGLRFDLVLVAMAMLLPAALTPFFATNLSIFKYWRKFWLIYLTVWFVFIAFMELSTPSFINQYDSRPNYIFVEYLKHYQEVGQTLLAEYPLQLLLAVIVVPLVSRLFYKLNQRLVVLEQPVKFVSALLLVPVLVLSFAMAGRSTLDHRAVNPSTVALTSDHLVNDLALNSTYTLLYAVYLSGHDEEGGVPYGKMPFEQVINIIHDEIGMNASDFTKPEWRAITCNKAACRAVPHGTW